VRRQGRFDMLRSGASCGNIAPYRRRRGLPTLDFSIDGIPYRTGPDVALVVLSAIAFPKPEDEPHRLEWLRKAVNSRTSEQLTDFPPGEMLPAIPAVHHRVIEAAKGPHFDRDRDAPEFGVDTLAVRAAAFILMRTLITSRGSVIDAIRAYTTGDGRRTSVPGASTETLRRAWRKCRPIAHFAAGLAYKRDLLRHDPRGWLEWAESLRKAGEKYRPPHTRKPLLDTRLTWKAPVSLGLRIMSRAQLDLPSDPGAVTIDP
jgi:hypothetical protein